MDGREQQWGKPRGEKRRRVGHDHHDGGAEHDDKDMDQRHRGEERGERCRRVGHGHQRTEQRGKSVERGAAAARVSVMEEVHMDGREQHWGEEREEKRRRVGRDHQDGGIEHDDQRHRGEERGERCRRVGHDHQGREQRGRSVERDHPNREQREQEKVVEGDHPNREQRRQEKVMEVKTEKSKAEGESITISDVERSFEFEGRLVGKRLVDADYDRSTHKEHKKRHRRRRRRHSCSSTN